MTEQLLLQDQTKRQVKAVLLKPPQAILIIGQPGSGKSYLGRYIAASLLGVSLESLDSQPAYLVVEKAIAKKEISIDSIRQIIKSLSLKSLGQTAGTSRVVHIKDAELLSQEAQNALLKIMEEPPPKTVFILSAPSAGAILPTIASRSQKLTVNTLSHDDVQEYFQAYYNEKSIRQAWNLSQGSAGLISALLGDEKNHPLKMAVDQSKQFLRLSPYERLILLDSLPSDENGIELLLDGLARILRELHKAALKSNRTNQANKLLECRRLVNDAGYSVSKKASDRLIGLNLVLQLPI